MLVSTLFSVNVPLPALASSIEAPSAQPYTWTYTNLKTAETDLDKELELMFISADNTSDLEHLTPNDRVIPSKMSLIKDDVEIPIIMQSTPGQQDPIEPLKIKASDLQHLVVSDVNKLRTVAVYDNITYDLTDNQSIIDNEPTDKPEEPLPENPVTPPTEESTDESTVQDSEEIQPESKPEPIGPQIPQNDKTSPENNPPKPMPSPAPVNRPPQPNPTVRGAVNIPGDAITADRLFEMPNVVGSGSAKIVRYNGNPDTANPNDNNGRPYDVLETSGSHNWTSVFSSDKNKLDFSRNFNLKAYINFGANDIDGLAFVMQRDPRGYQALTTANTSSDGQNLGVYGKHDLRDGLLRPTHPWESAIQNSVAIEMDLNPNRSGKAMFDKNVTTDDHMSLVLPAKEDSYTLSGLYEAVLGHNFTQSLTPLNDSGNIQNDTWFEFKVSYRQSNETLTYSLTNPVTGAVVSQSVKVNDPLPLQGVEHSIFDGLELTDDSPDKSVYWGFTTANGSNMGELKIAFAQVPAPSKASNDILNNETDESVAEDPTIENPTPKSVPSGTKLKFRSNLDVSSTQPMNITSYTATLDPDSAVTMNPDVDIFINGILLSEEYYNVTPNGSALKINFTTPLNLNDKDKLVIETIGDTNVTKDTKVKFSSKFESESHTVPTPSDLTVTILKPILKPYTISWSNDSTVTSKDVVLPRANTIFKDTAYIPEIEGQDSPDLAVIVKVDGNIVNNEVVPQKAGPVQVNQELTVGEHVVTLELHPYVEGQAASDYGPPTASIKANVRVVDLPVTGIGEDDQPINAMFITVTISTLLALATFIIKRKRALH